MSSLKAFGYKGSIVAAQNLVEAVGLLEDYYNTERDTILESLEHLSTLSTIIVTGDVVDRVQRGMIGVEDISQPLLREMFKVTLHWYMHNKLKQESGFIVKENRRLISWVE